MILVGFVFELDKRQKLQSTIVKIMGKRTCTSGRESRQAYFIRPICQLWAWPTHDLLQYAPYKTHNISTLQFLYNFYRGGGFGWPPRIDRVGAMFRGADFGRERDRLEPGKPPLSDRVPGVLVV